MQIIYFVEDDQSIRELVLYTLRSSGFEASGFENAQDFLEALKAKIPNLVLLDIMLPDQDGISILKKLRQNPDYKDIPVMMATAKSAEFDKVTALDSGADDYITKPFGMMELLSRVRALLRRCQAQQQPTQSLEYKEISIDELGHRVMVKGEEVVLTIKEFELLKALVSAPQRAFTRDYLLESIWGYDFDGETRTVDVHMRTLRQKLGSAAYLIKTIRGIGYKIGD